MRLLKSFHLMAFALVLLSIVGLCIAQRSVELLLVAGALAAMSWYVTEGPRGKHLPRWVSTLLVIAVSLNVFVELLPDQEDWVEVLGRFGVWMTIIKLYERKSPRDYRQLLLLSLLLMITGAVQSSELLFGVVLLLYAVLGLYVLLLFQLHTSHEHARVERRRATPRGSRLVPPVKTVFGPHLVGHFRALVATVGVTGLILSVLLFLIFPRGLGEGVVPTLRRTGGPRPSSFADTIELGGGARITDSRRPVMIVRLLDEQGEPIRLHGPLYLRGAALNRYQGGRWTGPEPTGGVLGIEPDDLVHLGGAPAAAAQTLTLEIDPFVASDVLFSMPVPVAISVAAPASVRFDPRTFLLRRSGRASRDGYTLRVQPVPRPETLRELADGAAPDRGRLSMRPSPRVGALARRLLEEGGVALYAPLDAQERYRWYQDAARVLAAHLQSSAFTYVTDLRDVVQSTRGGVDPIEQFLFDTRRGHCEYYASALAALCHELDIPVRVMTGFLAYEYDDEDEMYIVLEANAHAWNEVQSGPFRWTTVDPTPAETLRELHQGEATLADRLSWIYQRFEGSWNSAVASFDARSQSRIATQLDLGWADRLGRLVQQARQRLAEVNRAFYFGPAGYVWMGVVAFALVLAVLVLVKLMRRSRALYRTLRLKHLKGAEYQRMLRLGFYLDMLRVLERARLEKPAWRPPRLHARALALEHPEASTLVRRITDIFYAARYGRQALSNDELRGARALVDELAQQLQVRRR